MPEYGFSLANFVPYNKEICVCILIRENTSQRKPVFWHISRSVGIKRLKSYLFQVLCFSYILAWCTETAVTQRKKCPNTDHKKLRIWTITLFSRGMKTEQWLEMGCKVKICDILCNLVPFVQFKKSGKHQWRSVNFSKVAGLNFKTLLKRYSKFKPATLLKVTLLHCCFSRFLNCTNGTRSRKTSHLKPRTIKLF